MSEATLHPFPKQKKVSRQARRATRATKALRRQAATAAGIGLVAVTLTGLSLSHLAHGVEVVTGSTPLEAWAMAIGIDLGFVALELSQITIGDRLRNKVARYAKPAILGTLVGSAAMNAFAFGSQASNYYTLAAGILLGVSIPALIYAMTKVGAMMYIDTNSRGA